MEDEEAARKFAQEFNDMAEDQYSKDIEISWEYNTNITDYNQKRVVSYSIDHSATCIVHVLIKMGIYMYLNSILPVKSASYLFARVTSKSNQRFDLIIFIMPFDVFLLKVYSSVEIAEFRKEMADLANLYDWHLFKDEKLKRLFSRITDIGTAVQDDTAKQAKVTQ